MMRVLATLLLSAVAAPLPAGAWSSLHGCWHGEGIVRGMQARVALEFRPALEGRAHRLSFRNAMQADDGRQWRFLAEAVYLCDADAICRGHWYDNRGAILPMRAQVEEAGALSVEWGDASTERGRTRYAPHPDGTLAIVDEVQDASGQWRVFGETTARRVDPTLDQRAGGCVSE